MSRADLDAQRALGAIRERLALAYQVCCGLAPKQSVGELLDVLMRMPEWDKLQAALAAQTPSSVLITPQEAAAAGLECGDSSCAGCCSGDGPCMYDAQAPVQGEPVELTDKLLWTIAHAMHCCGYEEGLRRARAAIDAARKAGT